MWMMSVCARGLAIFSLLLLLISFFGGAGACFYMSTKHTESTIFLISGGALAAFGLIFTCCVYCNRNSMSTAIAIVDASADFFISTKRIVLVSMGYFLISMLFVLLWVAGQICVMSLNDFKKGDGSPQDKDMIWKSDVKGMMFFMCFGLLWLLKFIDDKVKFITMVSAATYYFSSNSEKNGSAKVCTGFTYAYTKHAGSLAFGSLIMTIISILRMVVDGMANSANEGGNPAAKAIACVAQCLVRCLEDLIEYINRTAYAYMAVTGDGFCSSAWNGFLLNLKYCAKFYFAIQIAGMFVFMGILACTAANTGLGFLLMTYATKEAANMESVMGPLILIGFMTFVIACIFLGLFDEAVLATIHCYAVDADLNGGTPAFGPVSYHEKLSRIDGYGAGQAAGFKKISSDEPGAATWRDKEETNQMF